MLKLFLFTTTIFLINFCSSTKITNKLSTTTNNYISTTISIGTPSQDFTVLIDTTFNTSWVFDKDGSLNFSSDQSEFNSSASSTFSSTSGSFTYSYFNASTNGSLGTDIFVINDANISSETFGLADYDTDTFKTEELDGVLALSRGSDIASNMVDQDIIDSEIVTLDIGSKKIYFGDYDGSFSNTTNTSINDSVSSLSTFWTFDISKFYVEDSVLLSGSILGVIDAGSPYITFSMSYNSFSLIWDNIGPDCSYSTSECSSSDTIANYIYFTINETEFYIFKDDYYVDSKLKIHWEDATSDAPYVIYLGKPFLELVQVQLDAQSDSIVIAYEKSSNSSAAKWRKVYIVLGCVLGFAIIFFAAYFYWNRIPPSRPIDQANTEEQRSLLRSQSSQRRSSLPRNQNINDNTNANATATATATATTNNATNNSNANNSSVNATQPRQRTNSNSQTIGTNSGQKEPKTAEELRERRLQFLNNAPQQQPENQ